MPTPWLLIMEKSCLSCVISPSFCLILRLFTEDGVFFQNYLSQETVNIAILPNNMIAQKWEICLSETLTHYKIHMGPNLSL